MNTNNMAWPKLSDLTVGFCNLIISDLVSHLNVDSVLAWKTAPLELQDAPWLLKHLTLIILLIPKLLLSYFDQSLNKEYNWKLYFLAWLLTVKIQKFCHFAANQNFQNTVIKYLSLLKDSTFQTVFRLTDAALQPLAASNSAKQPHILWN